MLSIFSCAYWPVVCLLWKNVCSGPLFIFNQIIWFLLLNFMRYILDISPYEIHDLQIFPPIPRIVFFFCLWFPFAVLKLLIRYHLFIFVFILITIGSESKKILLRFMSKNLLPSFSSKSFIVPGLIFRSFNPL